MWNIPQRCGIVKRIFFKSKLKLVAICCSRCMRYSFFYSVTYDVFLISKTSTNPLLLLCTVIRVWEPFALAPGFSQMVADRCPQLLPLVRVEPLLRKNKQKRKKNKAVLNFDCWGKSSDSNADPIGVFVLQLLPVASTHFAKLCSVSKLDTSTQYIPGK